MRSLTRPSVTCDKATPYLPRAVRSPQGFRPSYNIRALLVVVLVDQKVRLVIFIKWYGNMRVNFLANPIITITASEIAPFFFFFFFRSRYCMEFKTESLTHHCAMENRPLTRWMQYLREGYTVCVDCQPPAMNSVSLRCSGDGLDSDG